jgi:hypothetical protein
MALLNGASVTEFVFWPSITKHGFYWGYVRISGPTNWIFYAAPYLADLLTFAIFFSVCMWVLIRTKWIWLNIVIIGLISPFANSLYNYWGNAGSSNDVGKLLKILPTSAVHGYFLLTLLIYILGIFMVFRFSRTARFLKTRTVEIHN